MTPLLAIGMNEAHYWYILPRKTGYREGDGCGRGLVLRVYVRGCCVEHRQIARGGEWSPVRGGSMQRGTSPCK